MSWLLIRQKRQKIEELTQSSRQILDLAEAENRENTDEENGRFAEMHAEASGLQTVVENLERQLELESFANNSTDRSGQEPGREDTDGADEGEGRSAEEQRAFEHGTFLQYVRGGIPSLSDEQRASMLERQQQVTPEMRAMGVGSDPAGGFLVIDETFAGGIDQAMLQFGGMRRAGATIIPTSSGANLPIPTSDDTSNTGEQLGENATAANQDVAVGEVVLGEFTYSSKVVKVSFQLLADSAYPIDSWLAGVLGERIGRITNTKFTTGTGSGPVGLLEATTSTVTAASATAVTFDEILDLKHSVDPSYRQSPAAGFMFNDTTLLALKKLKDGQGGYLWHSGASDGTAFREPPTIDGSRYTINQDFSDIASAVKSMVYGDFSKYYIRDIGGPTMLRLTERYADALQVGFLLFQRHDGTVVNAGTNPLRHLLQAT